MQQLDDFIVVAELASCSMDAISLHFMISMVCLFCANVYDNFLLTHIEWTFLLPTVQWPQ